MADKEKYMIKVEGKLVEVSSEVYYAYFRMERQERWQEEKQQGHAVVSYDALDDGETVGVEVVPDLTTPSMEEAVMTREIHEKLHRAVDAFHKLLPHRDTQWSFWIHSGQLPGTSTYG